LKPELPFCFPVVSSLTPFLFDLELFPFWNRAFCICSVPRFCVSNVRDFDPPGVMVVLLPSYIRTCYFQCPSGCPLPKVIGGSLIRQGVFYSQPVVRSLLFCLSRCREDGTHAFFFSTAVSHDTPNDGFWCFLRDLFPIEWVFPSVIFFPFIFSHWTVRPFLQSLRFFPSSFRQFHFLCSEVCHFFRCVFFFTSSSPGTLTIPLPHPLFVVFWRELVGVFRCLHPGPSHPPVPCVFRSLNLSLCLHCSNLVVNQGAVPTLASACIYI